MIAKIIRRFINWFEKAEARGLKKKLGYCGENVTIEQRVNVGYPERMRIEEFAYIGPDASINALGKVLIKRGAIIGPRLVVHSANHLFKNASSIPYDETFDKKEIVIGENVWIGSDVILLPGAVIGEGCIIGAGSVISKEIPPFSIAIGNPVRIIKERDRDHYHEMKSKDSVYMKLKISGRIKPKLD